MITTVRGSRPRLVVLATTSSDARCAIVGGVLGVGFVLNRTPPGLDRVASFRPRSVRTWSNYKKLA
jgi:hypothetical protein